MSISEQNGNIQKEGTLVIVDGEMKLEPETLLKALAYILGTSGASIIYKRKHGIGTGTLYLQH